ncbi:MAG: STAS/SEC14 domain-containing protein [Bacteroidales bacterium]
MFHILDFTKDNLIAFQVDGKVKKEDYDKLKPLLEKVEKDYDTQKLYLELKNIEGIDLPALWEDFKVYFKHIRNFDKIAVVGSGDIEKKLSSLSNPFVSGEVRFFNVSESVTAREWLKAEE